PDRQPEDVSRQDDRRSRLEKLGPTRAATTYMLRARHWLAAHRGALSRSGDLAVTAALDLRVTVEPVQMVIPFTSSDVWLPVSVALAESEPQVRLPDLADISDEAVGKAGEAIPREIREVSSLTRAGGGRGPRKATRP